MCVHVLYGDVKCGRCGHAYATYLTSFGRNRRHGGHQLAEKYSCRLTKSDTHVIGVRNVFSGRLHREVESLTTVQAESTVMLG